MTYRDLVFPRIRNHSRLRWHWKSENGTYIRCKNSNSAKQTINDLSKFKRIQIEKSKPISSFQQYCDQHWIQLTKFILYGLQLNIKRSIKEKPKSWSAAIGEIITGPSWFGSPARTNASALLHKLRASITSGSVKCPASSTKTCEKNDGLETVPKHYLYYAMRAFCNLNVFSIERKIRIDGFRELEFLLR